jgi:hypothetical protein
MTKRFALPRAWLGALVLAFGGAGVLAAQGARPLDQAEDLPRRKPGLWRLSTVSPDIGMRTNDVCIEAGDSIIGDDKGLCARPTVTRAGDQVIVTLECGAGDQREIKSLLFTGDFQSWYRAQSRTTVAARRSGFTIEAKFLGETCASNLAR